MFFCIQKRGFSRYQPDFYIYDSLLYKGIINSGHFFDNMVELGNAKFDGIYHACKIKSYKSGWEKLKERKVILWATDHGPKCTFDLYAKAIFQYAADHLDVGVIFRPHGSLISELLMGGIWTMDDIEEIRKHCAISDNVVFDDSENYESAYSIADGIFVDAVCGIAVSALPTLKPICLVYCSKNDTVIPDVLEVTYILKNKYSFQEAHELELPRTVDNPNREGAPEISLGKWTFLQVEGANHE